LVLVHVASGESFDPEAFVEFGFDDCIWNLTKSLREDAAELASDLMLLRGFTRPVWRSLSRSAGSTALWLASHGTCIL
jgi:hypothetical protein